MVDSYLKFQKKREKKAAGLFSSPEAKQLSFTNLRNVLSNLCFVFQRPGTPALQDIFEKIREAIHKNGIRTTEFFKDHDKLRSGEITENQVKNFSCSYLKSSLRLALYIFVFLSFFFSFFNFKKCS